MTANERSNTEGLNLEQVLLVQEEQRAERLIELENDLNELERVCAADDSSYGATQSEEEFYQKIFSMIRSGEIDTDKGISMLSRSAEEGSALSYLYLGNLYADSRTDAYDPSLAVDHYKKAAELGIGNAFYRLGLCFNSGLGCEVSPEISYEVFIRGAELDDLDCICALGICREFGIGCEIDYEIAAAVYKRAADRGSATATNNLGGCYFYGHGVEQDKETAVELYRQASKLGNVNAECRLGICLEAGEGCEPDPQEAVKRYKNAAKKGSTEALLRLAHCYESGVGCEQNFARAFKHCVRAAELGSSEAMYMAGVMSINGRGTKKDPSTAYKMFYRASELKHAKATYEVGNCYFDGIGTVRNRAIAYMHYSNAYDLDNDHADAAFKIGLCKLRGLGTEKDEAAAFEWFSMGAALGSVLSRYMLGECFYYGVGTERNPAFAVKAYTEAITVSDEEDFIHAVPAMVALGICLETGDGVEKDTEGALALYKKATKYNDPTALYLTGKAIMSGIGARPELLVARGYMLRAARRDYLPAMLIMGIFADDGKGVAQNREDAKRWFAKAVITDEKPKVNIFDFPARYAESAQLCSESKIEAQYRLGMLVSRNNPSPQNYIQSFEYVSAAASMGHEGAQTEISKIFVHGGDLKSYYESYFSREDATFPSGDAVPDKETLSAAMNKLGDAFFDGKSLLKKNDAAAARCYKIAAELGHNDACYSYGWCLRHGVGVRENTLEAIKWLKMSADRGNAGAAYSYGLCCEEGAGTGVKNKRDALSYYRQAASAGHVEAAKRYAMLSDRDE